MIKRLLLTLTLLCLVFVSLPAEADDDLGCLGTSTLQVCDFHSHSTADDCEASTFARDERTVSANSALHPLGASATLYSSCFNHSWLECEHDRVYVQAHQGFVAWSFVAIMFTEEDCTGPNNMCSLYLFLYDGTTGTEEYRAVYNEPCEDTL